LAYCCLSLNLLGNGSHVEFRTLSGSLWDAPCPGLSHVYCLYLRADAPQQLSAPADESRIGLKARTLTRPAERRLVPAPVEHALKGSVGRGRRFLSRKTELRLTSASPVPNAMDDNAILLFSIKNLVWSDIYFANLEMNRMAPAHPWSRTNLEALLPNFQSIPPGGFGACF